MGLFDKPKKSKLIQKLGERIKENKLKHIEAKIHGIAKELKKAIEVGSLDKIEKLKKEYLTLSKEEKEILKKIYGKENIIEQMLGKGEEEHKIPRNR